MAYFGYLYRLLLGVWMGAILCFAGIFAPALFRVLGRDQAGAVVREVLPRFDSFALGAGVILMAVSLLAEGARGRCLLRLALLALMTAFVAVSLFGITPRMEALRAEAGGGIAALEPTHPLRREFGRLHGISTLLMLGQLVLGAIALGIPIREKAGQTRSAAGAEPRAADRQAKGVLEEHR
jgi:Domain of unknown function (DUF4149)